MDEVVIAVILIAEHSGTADEVVRSPARLQSRAAIGRWRGTCDSAHHAEPQRSDVATVAILLARPHTCRQYHFDGAFRMVRGAGRRLQYSLTQTASLTGKHAAEIDAAASLMLRCCTTLFTLFLF